MERKNKKKSNFINVCILCMVIGLGIIVECTILHIQHRESAVKEERINNLSQVETENLFAEEDDMTEVAAENTMEEEKPIQSDSDEESTLEDGEEKNIAPLGLYVIDDQNEMVMVEAFDTGDFEGELQNNLLVVLVEQKSMNDELWDKIDYYGLTGWIRDSSLRKVSEDIGLITSTDKAYIYTQLDNEVYMYSEPSDSSDQVKGLVYGNELILSEVENGWGKVTSENETGWIDMKNVSIYLNENPYFVNVVPGTRINMRAEPDVESGVVGRVESGSVFIVKDFRNGWGMIELDSQSGWVMLRYMTPCLNEAN